MKAEKKAAQQADAIVGEAIAKVKAKRGEATEDEKALGQQVKSLRDNGMAWWQIAHSLSLPGSADNVAQGKSGASKARALYKKAFGELPTTARSLAAKTGGAFGHGPKPQGVKARRDVIKKDPALDTMFDEPLTGSEIIEMLRGKKITLLNSVGGQEETHRIHERYNIRIAQANVNTWHPPMRVEYAITFRDANARDDREVPMNYRDFPGGSRTVRLSSIIRVSA